MVIVDSIKGNMKRVVSEQVDSELLSLGFQYEMKDSDLYLIGVIDLRGETVKCTFVNNRQLYLEVWDFDECKWSVKHSYNFVESTNLLGLVEDVVRKENR